MAKLVFHVDVNSAFLSWEAARRVANGEPDIRLIPAVIGGDREKRTGVVLAKSIPAKKFGIKTGEPIGMALRKCPDLFMAKDTFMNDHVNQTFGQMNKVALEWLKDRDPVEIARRAGVSYDEKKQVFTFSSMGILLTLTWPDYTVSPQIGGWHYLLILHYLHIADGMPLADREMSFSQMNSGMVRGGGIDRKFEHAIQAMKQLDEQTLDTVCAGMGAEKVRSNADVAYRIPFLPRFPVTLKVWLPDEEFPASGRLLVDKSADHYFSIEDAVTVAELLIEKIAIPKEHRSFVNQ